MADVDFRNETKSKENLVCDSLTKFFELWRGRQSATFHLECRNGEATFHFSAFLGHPDKVRKKVSNKMSPSKIRRNKARAEAHAAKKNLDKDSSTSTSHESNPTSEFGPPVRSSKHNLDLENGEPALGISFLGESLLIDDSRKVNIDHEEVASEIVTLAKHDSGLFDSKCGFNSELYHKALAETLFSHYGEHVLNLVPISEQYLDMADKMIPSSSNPVIPEMHCKECKEVPEKFKQSGYSYASYTTSVIWHTEEDDGWELDYTYNSCPIE